MSRIVFVLLGTIFLVKGFYTNADIGRENANATIPVQTRQQEDAPSQLEGSIEDEALSARISAQINSVRKAYITNIEFYNKSGQSLDLIYDCGLLISNDHFALKSDICPAVESMLLQSNKRESVSITLPEQFFNTAGNMITVRYRQGNVTKDLEIKLETSVIQ